MSHHACGSWTGSSLHLRNKISVKRQTHQKAAEVFKMENMNGCLRCSKLTDLCSYETETEGSTLSQFM